MSTNQFDREDYIDSAAIRLLDFYAQSGASITKQAESEDQKPILVGTSLWLRTKFNEEYCNVMGVQLPSDNFNAPALIIQRALGRLEQVPEMVS